MLSTFDCESLVNMLTKELRNLRECKIDYSDDNADYGFINLGIYNPKYITSYNIIADDYNSFEINDENNHYVGKVDSFKKIAKLIADHFRNNFI